jgi:hypothetical protein
MTQELYEKEFGEKIKIVKKGWFIYLMHLLIYKSVKRVMA